MDLRMHQENDVILGLFVKEWSQKESFSGIAQGTHGEAIHQCFQNTAKAVINGLRVIQQTLLTGFSQRFEERKCTHAKYT